MRVLHSFQSLDGKSCSPQTSSNFRAISRAPSSKTFSISPYLLPRSLPSSSTAAVPSFVYPLPIQIGNPAHRREQGSNFVQSSPVNLFLSPCVRQYANVPQQVKPCE